MSATSVASSPKISINTVAIGTLKRLHPNRLRIRLGPPVAFLVIFNKQTLLSDLCEVLEKRRMRGFGDKLREPSAALGLADSVVAARVGLSQQRYRNYVADENEPDLETLVRICAVLDISPGRLLGVEPRESAQTEAAVLRSRMIGTTQAMTVPMLRIATAVVEAVAKEALRASRLPTETLAAESSRRRRKTLIRDE